MRRGKSDSVFLPNAPDAAEIIARPPVELITHFGGNEVGMLDPFAREIYNVKCAVGTSGEVDGPEPGVGRGEKFFALLDAKRFEGRAIRFEAPMVNQAQQWLAHEGITRASSKHVTAIDGETTACVEEFHGLAIVPPLWAGDRVEASV